MELLEKTTPTARKDHRCDFCGGVIQKGEKYERQSIANDGSVYTWKSHKVCNDIADEIQDRYSEGVTADYFQEQVDDLYIIMFGEGCDFSQESLQKLLDRLKEKQKSRL